MSKLPYEHRLNQHKSTRIDEQKLKKSEQKKLRNKLDDKSFVIPTMKVDMNRGVLSICMYMSLELLHLKCGEYFLSAKN